MEAIYRDEKFKTDEKKKLIGAYLVTDLVLRAPLRGSQHLDCARLHGV